MAKEGRDKGSGALEYVGPEFETLTKELEAAGLGAEVKRLQATIKTAASKETTAFDRKVKTQALAAYMSEMIQATRDGRNPELPPSIMATCSQEGYEDIARDIARRWVETTKGRVRGIFEEALEARALLEQALAKLNAYIEATSPRG